MIKYAIFEPTAEISAQEGLIIMPNEISAGLDDYHGARAKDLATITGLPVLAYERPMSASTARFSLSQRRYYLHNAASIQNDTATQLSKIIDKEIISEELNIAGHSAGAAEAIGIMASQQLAIRHGVFTDPPAVIKHFPIYAEVVEYGGYQLFTERNKPEESKADTSANTKPELKPSGYEAFKRTLADLVIYSSYHRSDAAYINLKNIAEQMPQVNVDLVFPELTFTASPESLREIAADLNAVRPNFRVDILAGQYHSYFNNYKVFAEVVKLALVGGSEQTSKQ